MNKEATALVILLSTLFWTVIISLAVIVGKLQTIIELLEGLQVAH